MSGKLLFRVLVVSLASAVMTWAGFCGWFYIGDNHELVLRTVTVQPSLMQITHGEGHEKDGRLYVGGPGSWGEAQAVAALPIAFPSEQLARIEVEFERVGSYNMMSIGAATTTRLSGVQETSVEWVDERIAQVSGKGFLIGDGPIRMISVRIRGSLKPAFVIDSIRMYRDLPEFGTLQAMLLQSMLSGDGWTHRSINQNRIESAPLAVTPVTAVVAWLVIGVGLLFGWSALERSASASNRAGGLIVLFILAWVALDAGWQVSLWARHVSTLAGNGDGALNARNVGDQSRAEELKGFMDDLKSGLGDSSRRIVILSETDFDYLRARYFAVPHPVVGRKGVSSRWLWRLNSGDVLVRLGRSGELIERQRDAASASDEAVDELDAWEVDEVTTQPPWVIVSRWVSFEQPLVARLELQSDGLNDAPGWVRIEIQQRAKGQQPRLWSVREIFLYSREKKSVSIAFFADAEAEFRFRVRPLNDIRFGVQSIELEKGAENQDLITLSPDAGSSYILVRKILKRGDKAAWEVL